MFETFVINEILKSYSNEGLECDFDVFYLVALPFSYL